MGWYHSCRPPVSRVVHFGDHGDRWGRATYAQNQYSTPSRDGTVIAKTALGMPDALLAVADGPPEIETARSLAAQRDFWDCESTRSKNRLRSILLESCPELEAQADLSDPATLELMAAVGGPWSISEASPQSVGALARCRGRGMPHGKALKAAARKRPKVICTIMGDKVPHAA